LRTSHEAGVARHRRPERLGEDHAHRAARWSEGVEYLNPDDVAQERFGDWNSPQAVLAAAQWVTERREALLAQGAGIAFETVFSGADKVDFMVRARRAGYFVRVFFVGTRDPRINAARVIQGGHTVPIEKIISRYSRSMANLTAAIRLADRVYVYDNSVDDAEAQLCVRTQEAHLRKIYAALPDWVSSAVSGLPRHEAFVDLRAG
jgi:predicted ABC-type ATPase